MMQHQNGRPNMGESDQFKRKPRRKPSRGKSVAASAEAKKAYAKLMDERTAKELAVGRHLPPDMKR
jgi:hypothetical protein